MPGDGDGNDDDDDGDVHGPTWPSMASWRLLLLLLPLTSFFCVHLPSPPRRLGSTGLVRLLRFSADAAADVAQLATAAGLLRQLCVSV